METTTKTPNALNPWVGTVARWVLAFVWLTAGFAKVADPIGTANAVRAYRLLPDTAAAVFGYALPTIEIVLGALLLLGVSTRAVAVVTGGLMVMFIFGVATAWARGLILDCGCFGARNDLGTEVPADEYLKVIVRDVGYGLLALWLLVFPRTRLALTNPHTNSKETDEQ